MIGNRTRWAKGTRLDSGDHAAREWQEGNMEYIKRVAYSLWYGVYINIDEPTKGKEYVLCRGGDHESKIYGYYILVNGEFRTVLHRVGFPAVCPSVKDDATIEWYFNGRYISGTQKYCELCGFSDEKTVFWLLKYGEKLPEHLDQL